MAWPLLMLGNVAVGLGFAAQQYYESRQRGRRPSWRGSVVSSALPTAGFAVQQALERGYGDWEEPWVEEQRVPGFNARTWGKNVDVGAVKAYGLGNWQDSGWS